MDKDFVLAQAEQDQQWMAYDEWYAKPETTVELTDVFEILDAETGKGTASSIRRMDKHGLEIVRVLALHCLRELMLRQQQAKERTKQELQE